MSVLSKQTVPRNNVIFFPGSSRHTVVTCYVLGACAYNSTGRKYAPISEMRLITNDTPRIGSALPNSNYSFSTPYD